MLSSKYYYTWDEVLESLCFLMDEYCHRHAIWFAESDEWVSGREDKCISESRNSLLVKYAKALYPYVFERKYDLSNTNFECLPLFEYPYCQEPSDLFVAAFQLYAFWISFIGSDTHGNPYMEDKAMPISILAVEGYLRFRFDFSSSGSFNQEYLISDLDGSVHDEKWHALFTLGEISFLSGLSDSTVRGKATSTSHKIYLPLFFDEGLVVARNINLKGAKVLKSYGYSFPTEFEDFFTGKVGGGVKKLARHKELAIFLASEGDYQPTKFYYSRTPPYVIPDYTDSQIIHQAIERWVQRQKQKDVSRKALLDFIGASYTDKKANNIFYEQMAEGRVRLSFCTLILINSFMILAEGEYDEKNPFSQILT